MRPREAYSNVARAYLPNPAATAAAIQADLAAVGISVQVLEQESGIFLDNVDTGNVDLFLLGWFADYPHPANFFVPHFCADSLGFGPATRCFAVNCRLQWMIRT